MQGLMRQSKLGASTGSSKEHRKDSTTKLMETATKMMKNGVTPDVLEFISSTITELNTNVLGEITREYVEDQRYIDELLQRLTDAADAIPDDCEETNAVLSGHNVEHKVCRSEEAVQCARCRKCEAELTIIWNRLKVAETEMRRIHDAIHGEWCLRDGFDYHPTIPQCWDWPLEGHWEGPETSQSVTEYCTTDVSSAIRDFRMFSVTHFASYIAQKTIVFNLWEEYYAKVTVCGACDTALDAKVSVCDDLQTDYRASVCTAASENRNHRRTFGHEWEDVLVTYRTAIGDCRISPMEIGTTLHGREGAVMRYPYDASGPICDPNTEPHNVACTCIGILEEEQDRKREWESLHIVTCLLETVYTHVVHSIETDEPCPTMTSDGERVESEINYCHVIEASLTANLTHTMCMNSGDPYNVDDCLPSPPPLCPPIEPPCTSQFIWEEQGFFGSQLQTSYNTALAAEPDLASYFTALSEKGWSGCSAPLVCVECEGMMPQNPNLELAQLSIECKAHERYLRPGMTNGETFRCLATTHGEHGSCVSAATRCNGHSNCEDGSDESGCDTLWGMPADLRQASVEECREGVTVAPGSFDDVQFFCASGECTSIEARCNGVNNCADGSDEAGCTFTSAGVTIEATSGFTSSKETISASSMVFHDRDYHFESLGSLSGMTYIKSSNEDKHTSQGKVQMKLRMPQPMTVYVAKSTRANAPAHELAWLSEVGADGNPLWRVSELQGASYSGSRMTRQSEWIMGAPADYEPFEWQSGGDPLMQHEDWAHARHTVQLDQGFLDGDVAPSRIPVIPWGDDHFSTVVYERTFSAGVVSMPGNSYVDQAGDGDGSYLMLVANPNTPPVPPVLPPTGEAQYLGCFVDDSARDLGAMESGGATYTYATCLARCEGSRFMSLQWGGECFCADAYGTASHYAKVSDSQCNVIREPCTSSGTHNCGGTWHQAIYAIGNLGNEIMLQYSNPSVGANGLCVSMSHNSGGNAGCDESSCNMHGASDATMQTCDSSDAGQKYIHDTHSGQLRSSLGDSRCLHVSTSSTHGGCEPFTLQTCMSHDTRQQFNLESVAGTTVWRNVATNLAIDSNSYRNTVDNWIWACGGTNTAKYFDAVPAVDTPLHEQQCSGTFEAEDATVSGAVEHADTASAGHQGFTGRSFVDYLAATDDFVEWTVQGCSGGSATASFRYALGSGNRPMQVLVNGVQVESALSFPSTGSWASWSEASFTVSLNAGTNVVKLVASGSSGANMDSLIIH